ncbi:MAG: hypothetical protein JST21_05140 [Bacteroidetes bacterium]|nr:hypothetical protein [Bacteroidota bacterium]
MKVYLLVLAIFFLFFCIKVNAQKNNSPSINEDTYTLPSYYTEQPNIVNLPDSFCFKQKGYNGFFLVTGNFDTCGNLLEILPQHLFVKNKSTDLIVKEYMYWKGWEDSALNISKAEAERYVMWAQKALPQIVHLRRSPFRCDEKQTNKIVRGIELRLE